MPQNFILPPDPYLFTGLSGMILIGYILFYMLVSQPKTTASWDLTGFFTGLLLNFAAMFLLNLSRTTFGFLSPFQDAFVLVGSVGLFRFAFHFFDTDQPPERAWLPWLGAVPALLAVGYSSWYAYMWFTAPQALVAPPLAYWLLVPGITLLAIFVFWRRMVSLARRRPTGWRWRKALTVFWSPPAQPAVLAYRNFTLALLVGLSPTLFVLAGEFPQLLGGGGTASRHIGFNLAILISIAVTALVYFNHAPQRVSFMVKLVGASLVVVLAISNVLVIQVINQVDSQVALTLIITIMLSSGLVIFGFPLFFRLILVTPLNNLLQGVGQIKQGDFDVSVPVQHDDELGILAAAFNQMAQDLGEARQTQARFAAELAQRDLFHSMFEGHSAMMLLVNPETGHIVRANQPAAALMGYPVNQLQTMSNYAIGNSPTENIGQLLTQAAQGQRNYFETNYQLAGGQVRDLEVYVSPLVWQEQTLLFTIVHDITARKQAEQALRDSKEQYQLLVETSTDVIWTINEAEQFTYISPAIQQLRGLTPAEAMRETVAEAICPEFWPRITESLQKSAAHKAVGQTDFIDQMEIQQPHKNGSRVWVEVITRELYSDRGERIGALGISRNITRRKAMEAELRQAKEAAENANQAKSAFLANMSHELRAPLSGVLGYTQLLQEHTPLTPEQEEYVEIIDQSGQHLLTLINDLMDIAKIEAGRLSLQPTSFELGAFLLAISQMARVWAEQKQLEFITEFAAGLPAAIRADEKRLRQILINLLGNAVKFTQTGRVIFTVSPQPNHPAPPAGHSRLEFKVQDNGPGIPAQDLAKIFQPFYRGTGQSAAVEGSGLGLAVSQQLAGLMGSEIEVESEPGRGSVFRLLLTIPVGTEPSLLVETSPQVISGYLGRRRLILVIDDLPVNRTVLRDVLSKVGFEVIEADNGATGLELAAQASPHLVLTDLRMPGTDGFSFVRQVRQNPALRDLPVIGISASAFEEDSQQFLEAGGDDFLPKPVDLNQLLALLGQYLSLTWTYKAPPAAVGPPGHINMLFEEEDV